VQVPGRVMSPLKLSVEELRTQFEPVEVIAVNQCSGNSRGFFQPRVPGGQSANGAMGNAKWKGVRLKDVLEMAGPSLSRPFRALSKGKRFPQGVGLGLAFRRAFGPRCSIVFNAHDTLRASRVFSHDCPR
jgi:predicted DNA-binding transcriptional regulator AlpA